MTIKEHIDEIRREAMTEIDGNRSVFLLQRLSALIGSVTEEWIEAEMNYNRYYEAMTDKYEKVTEARVKAKASIQYEIKLRKEAVMDTTKELMNSLKYVIKNKLAEASESKYQT